MRGPDGRTGCRRYAGHGRTVIARRRGGDPRVTPDNDFHGRPNLYTLLLRGTAPRVFLKEFRFHSGGLLCRSVADFPVFRG